MLRVVRAASNGIESVELHGAIHRACACGEPNPSFVACARCGTFNYSGHPCRACGGPGDLADPWTVCPACGRQAVVEETLLGAWYRNPARRALQRFREWWRRIGR